MCRCGIDPSRATDRWCCHFQVAIPGVRAIRFRFGRDWADGPVIFFNVTLDYYDFPLTRRVEDSLRDKLYSLGVPEFAHFNFTTVEELAKRSDRADWERQ